MCDAVPRPSLTESCNGIDDDCDGLIDESRVCGPFIERNCQFFLAWTDGNNYAAGVYDSIGRCPESDRNEDWPTHCVGTRGEGRMRALRFPRTWGVDSNDNPGVMFRCQADDDDPVADWIQRSCRVFIGYSRDGIPAGRIQSWGLCPEQAQSNEGNLRCVSSGPDGRFHLMDPISENDSHVAGRGDSWGLAFLCSDDDEQRSQAVESSVSLVLAFANQDVNGADNDVDWWPGCSGGRAVAQNELANCAETDGQSGFAVLPLLRTWAQGYSAYIGSPTFRIGIALKSLLPDENQQ